MRSDHDVYDHDQLEVVCPTCLESSAVPVALVLECRRLADGCGGAWVDYECPAQYYARLSVPAAPEDEVSAGSTGDGELARALAQWETDGGATGDAATGPDPSG